ncbi:MAG: VWA domain-containing protein [Planctomycetota bacterium]
MRSFFLSVCFSTVIALFLFVMVYAQESPTPTEPATPSEETPVASPAERPDETGAGTESPEIPAAEPPKEELPVVAEPEPAKKPALPPELQKFEERNLDIAFVIDSSGSMTWTDPQQFRKVAVKAFLDITQDRGGDRIAVLQFAGWNETDSFGSVVFPFTEIPANEEDRDKIIKEAKEAIETKMTSFGKATDFNYAFKKGIFQIMEERKEKGSKNDLWVVLLTDGSMDVVEGSTVREEYKEKAIEEGKKVTRETLNKVATELFEKEVLPQLAVEKGLFITCISLSLGESDPLLIQISNTTAGSSLKVSKERLKGIFLEALATLPDGFYREGFNKGFAYSRSEVRPNGVFKDTLHVYQGATTTRLLIFSSNPSFSVDIID